jgi:hypothetical protein
MRRFTLTALFGIVLLNCFLAYSGQYLSSQVRELAAHHHSKLPALSMLALAIPPWFYPVAGAAVVVAILGLTRRLGDRGLVYSVVGLLLLDIIALLVSLWGVGVLSFPNYEVISPAA